MSRGLGRVQFAVLEFVKDNAQALGDVHVAQIHDGIDMRADVVSRAITSLCERGLLVRLPHRRVVVTEFMTAYHRRELENWR